MAVVSSKLTAVSFIGKEQLMLEKRIGSTVFVVSVRFSGTSNETARDNVVAVQSAASGALRLQRRLALATNRKRGYVT